MRKGIRMNLCIICLDSSCSHKLHGQLGLKLDVSLNYDALLFSSHAEIAGYLFSCNCLRIIYIQDSGEEDNPFFL